MASSTSGVVVQGVAADSDAAAKGLRGDVIARAGDHRVASRADVLFLVSRNGRTIFIPLGVKSAQG